MNIEKLSAAKMKPALEITKPGDGKQGEDGAQKVEVTGERAPTLRATRGNDSTFILPWTTTHLL